MTPADWIIIAIIVLSALIAAAQGFLREVIALAGLIAGLELALWNYRVLSVPLGRHIEPQRLADIISFVFIALLVMILAGVIGRLVSSFAQKVGLGGLDRLLGGCFGILRGCILVVLGIIALAAFMPQSTWLNGSKLAPYFLSAANTSSLSAPPDLRNRIQTGLASLRHDSPAWIQLGLRKRTSTN